MSVRCDKGLFHFADLCMINAYKIHKMRTTNAPMTFRLQGCRTEETISILF
jgi:hypothetical protein